MTKQYSSFFLCVILCCLAAEFIGPIKLSLGRFTVTFLPLLYAMLLMLVLYLAKPVGVCLASAVAPEHFLVNGVLVRLHRDGQFLNQRPCVVLDFYG